MYILQYAYYLPYAAVCCSSFNKKSMQQGDYAILVPSVSKIVVQCTIKNIKFLYIILYNKKIYDTPSN